MRGNISSIASWAYAALAYATITASNSTTELTYLCNNFNDTSSRYYYAFPESSGDMAKLARNAVCAASKSANPAPQPVWDNTLWYLKSYLAGMFTVQGYYGKFRDTQYYMDMCWYLESSLLRGLWLPCRDTQESAVDAESSYCASAGYYAKGDYSKYTNATQPPEIAHQADVLVTKMLTSVLKVVLKKQEQIEYICANWDRFEPGVKSLGAVSEVVENMVCKDKEVVEVEQARKDQLGAMTELFIFQLLNAGTYKDYHTYLCQKLQPDGLSKVGLDGKEVVAAACAAAKNEGS